jgi:hypothetical protein
MRDVRGLVLLILPLALAALPARSDDTLISGKSVCVFPLVNKSPNAAAQKEYQKPLSEAVQQEFGEVGFTIIPQESWISEADRLKIPPERIGEAQQALPIAQGAAVDMAVIGSYSRDKDRILVSVQCYDVAAGTLITGFLHTWRFNLGFYNSLHAEIADLVQRVIFSTAPQLITLQENVRVDEITFTSPQNGMEVVLEGQRNLGRIQDGSLVFQTNGVKAGTPLLLEKRLEGYHTVWQTVNASPRIALPALPKMDTFALEVNWTAGQLEGAGATLRWYPVPNWLMIGFSEYLYTQIPFIPDAIWPIHSDSELFAGLYLFLPPQSTFRMGISAGAGVILTSIPLTSLPLFTDVYINLLSAWLEWRPGDFTLLFEIQGKLTLGIGDNLLGKNGLHWGPFLPPLKLGVVIPWR